MRTTLWIATAALLLPVASRAQEDNQSFDGLIELKGTRAARAWILPDVDMSSYTKMRVEGAGIHYRPVKKVSRAAARSGRHKEFPLTEQDKARLEAIVDEQFNKELAKTERFEIVETNGPDTIIVRGALLDVVSSVPPEPIGAGNIYVSSFGEATLAIEIVDSESGTVLARAVERRAARPPAGMLTDANPVTGQAEVRRLMASWARGLREVLDDLDRVWDEA